LVRFDSITQDEVDGGWDIKNIEIFNLELLVKNIKRAFKGEGLRQTIIGKKFLNNLNLEE